jgi:hypothetical protein
MIGNSARKHRRGRVEVLPVTPVDEIRLRKTREKSARRAAERQGLRIEKSRQRDPRGRLHNTWQIVDADTGELVAGHHSGYGLDLDTVERILDQGRNGGR